MDFSVLFTAGDQHIGVRDDGVLCRGVTGAVAPCSSDEFIDGLRLFADTNKVPEDFVAPPAVSAPVSFSNMKDPEAPPSAFLSAAAHGAEVLRIEPDGTIRHRGAVIGCEPKFLIAMQYILSTVKSA
jgi:hypothetical protein